MATWIPIKAARGGRNLSDELTIHYGLLPRANRGIFAINELPDLAGKIQVGLFNIMQEGDVQIKGYPVRMALDVLLVFTANPEDYTARGKIITPLKDRIGSEIRTHYPATVAEGMSITAQESWTERDGKRRVEVPRIHSRNRRGSCVSGARGQARRPALGREPAAADQRPRKCAEQRRAARRAEPRFGAVARVSDVYAAIPAMTGKFELEYEGELRGAENIARELIRAAVGKTFTQVFFRSEFSAGGAMVRDRRRIEGSGERLERGASGAAEEDSGPVRACGTWALNRRTTPRCRDERRGIHSGRAVGAQADQPERGARIFCRSAQVARAARSARAFAAACRDGSSIERCRLSGQRRRS